MVGVHHKLKFNFCFGMDDTRQAESHFNCGISSRTS